MMADDIDSAARIAELERRLETEVARLSRLIDLAALLNSTPNRDDLLTLIMHSAREFLSAEASSLLLLDEMTQELRFAVATGERASDLQETRIPAAVGIAGWVLEHGEPVCLEDAASDERFFGEVDATVGFRTRNLLAVPLMAKDGCIGVVEVLNKVGGEHFDDTDQETAKALASLAAVAIENASIYARLTEAVVEARLGTTPET